MVSWSPPESLLSFKYGSRYDCWILIISNISYMMCGGITSDMQAKDFMYLHRILHTKITEFRLSDWISNTREKCGNWNLLKVNRNKVINRGWRYASFDSNHAIHVVQFCLIVSSDISNFLLSTLSPINCTHSPDASHLWSGINYVAITDFTNNLKNRQCDV